MENPQQQRLLLTRCQIAELEVRDEYSSRRAEHSYYLYSRVAAVRNGRGAACDRRAIGVWQLPAMRCLAHTHALALPLTNQGLLGYFLLVGPASRARTNQRQTPERNPPSVAGCRGARWPADRARQRGWLHAAASTGGCRDGCRAGVGAGLG